MRLKDGDFITTADTEAEAIGIVERCNKLIAREQMSDELEAYHTKMRLNKGSNPHRGYVGNTWAVLLRRKEAECAKSK